MRIEEQIVDTLIVLLDEAEQELSDECYEYLNSFEDIEDIFVYQRALVDYLQILKSRFLCDDEDEQDEEVIVRMLPLINTLMNAMLEQPNNSDIIIDED